MTDIIALIIAAICLFGYAREYRRRVALERVAPKRGKGGRWVKRGKGEAA